MTVINPPDGPIYRGNGLDVHRVQFPEEEAQGEAMTVQMDMSKNILYPVGDRACGIFGIGVGVHAIVDGNHVTTGNFCVTESVNTAGYSHAIDIPWPDDAGLGDHEVSLYFTQTDDGSDFFDVGYKDWPPSTVGAYVTQVEPSNGDPSDPDDPGGGDPSDPTDPDQPNGGDSPDGGSGPGGQTILIGLVAAGLYARSKRSDS